MEPFPTWTGGADPGFADPAGCDCGQQDSSSCGLAKLDKWSTARPLKFVLTALTVKWLMTQEETGNGSRALPGAGCAQGPRGSSEPGCRGPASLVEAVSGGCPAPRCALLCQNKVKRPEEVWPKASDQAKATVSQGHEHFSGHPGQLLPQGPGTAVTLPRRLSHQRSTGVPSSLPQGLSAPLRGEMAASPSFLSPYPAGYPPQEKAPLGFSVCHLSLPAGNSSCRRKRCHP